MLKIILILFFLFLIVDLIISTLALYHLWRFGFEGDNSKRVIVIYSIFMIIIVLASFIAIGLLNWNIKIAGF